MDERRPPVTRMNGEWDSDAAEAAVLALQEQANVFEEGPADTAKRVVGEGLVMAALRLSQLTQSDDEKVAMQASKYLLDRGLGQLTPGGDFVDRTDDLLKRMLEEFTSESTPPPDGPGAVESGSASG